MESVNAAKLRVFALDGALLGAFMLSACVSVTLVEHPSSPLAAVVLPGLARRALVGLAMGLTAVGLIYSPWGKRSGAFMNPALTLCFLRLGKLTPRDACGYVLAQFAGGVFGTFAARLALGAALAHPAVNFVVTAPGAYGEGVAWFAEFTIAFVLVAVVVAVNRRPRLSRFGGVFAAVLVALFITFEAPLSGMSLNPARTLASAVVAGSYHGLWIYLTAPVLGMLASVELERRIHRGTLPCGKLSHDPNVRGFVECDCGVASDVAVIEGPSELAS